jgi:hypothetical protein
MSHSFSVPAIKKPSTLMTLCSLFRNTWNTSWFYLVMFKCSFGIIEISSATRIYLWRRCWHILEIPGNHNQVCSLSIRKKNECLVSDNKMLGSYSSWTGLKLFCIWCLTKKMFFFAFACLSVEIRSLLKVNWIILSKHNRFPSTNFKYVFYVLIEVNSKKNMVKNKQTRLKTVT